MRVFRKKIKKELRKYGGAFGWSTATQAGMSLVRFSILLLEFFIYIILPATRTVHTFVLRMADFGDGAGGKGVLMEGCDIFFVRNHLR